MVKCIDDNVGKILDTLRQLDLLDRTIVVFTSDHGDLCGEHGRLNKGVPYEGSARIPFVIYHAGVIPPGTVVDQALSCVDFLPTAMSLMGLPAAEAVEGRDASPLLTGRSAADWEDIAFLRGTQGTGWLCAVSDDYKLVYSPQDRPWLFDLENDPDELTNCFDDPQCRSIVREMTVALAAYCRQHNDPYGDDPKVKAQMDAAMGE
jgi:arylsulfatase A-like enzyme